MSVKLRISRFSRVHDAFLDYVMSVAQTFVSKYTSSDQLTASAQDSQYRGRVCTLACAIQHRRQTTLDVDAGLQFVSVVK